MTDMSFIALKDEPRAVERLMAKIEVAIPTGQSATVQPVLLSLSEREWCAIYDLVRAAREPGKGCECCDHPLQHAIREALDAFDNAVPPLKASAVVNNLRVRLDQWHGAKVERRSDATALSATDAGTAPGEGK